MTCSWAPPARASDGPIGSVGGMTSPHADSATEATTSKPAILRMIVPPPRGTGGACHLCGPATGALLDWIGKLPAGRAHHAPQYVLAAVPSSCSTTILCR